jgi:hypothetical protein
VPTQNSTSIKNNDRTVPLPIGKRRIVHGVKNLIMVHVTSPFDFGCNAVTITLKNTRKIVSRPLSIFRSVWKRQRNNSNNSSHNRIRGEMPYSCFYAVVIVNDVVRVHSVYTLLGYRVWLADSKV